jgi:high-affinity nickel-transport protein
MESLIKSVFGNVSATARHKVTCVYAILLTLNVAAWSWAFVAFHRYLVLMGTSLLAYSFGLRHAVDADHIAAIDNVTRKLMEDGKRPMTVGLMFSLGHSTIVVIASVGIAATALALQSHLDAFKEIGGVIGTLVSTLFLFLIALINLMILGSVLRAFRRVQRGESYVDEDFDILLANRGFLARIFRPVFRLVTKSWHMYFLGFLFGLGFDTATEIGVLGISAAGAAHGMSVWSILVFPALFTAGMALVDTTDGILMLGAYGWAFVKPVRKLYYNIIITAVSVIVAILIGGVEGLGLLSGQLHLTGAFWSVVAELNDNFGLIGYVVIAVFIGSWLISTFVYKWKRFEELERPFFTDS